jgi:hypothetical protein
MGACFFMFLYGKPISSFEVIDKKIIQKVIII